MPALKWHTLPPTLPSMQALLSGETHRPATLPPFSMASAMFSLTWPKDRAPASIGSAQLQAFITAVKAYLPGAVMHVVRHVSETTCASTCGRYRSQSARRATLAAVTPSHHGGSSYSCRGRVVFNAVVASPSRNRLAQLVWLVDNNPGKLWSPRTVRMAFAHLECPTDAHTRKQPSLPSHPTPLHPTPPNLPAMQFGKLQAEGLSGIRLVPIKGYKDPQGCPPQPSPSPSPSPSPQPEPTLPNPLVIEARANSHVSATITGAAPAGLTCKQASETGRRTSWGQCTPSDQLICSRCIISSCVACAPSSLPLHSKP